MAQNNWNGRQYFYRANTKHTDVLAFLLHNSRAEPTALRDGCHHGLLCRELDWRRRKFVNLHHLVVLHRAPSSLRFVVLTIQFLLKLVHKLLSRFLLSLEFLRGVSRIRNVNQVARLAICDKRRT